MICFSRLRGLQTAVFASSLIAGLGLVGCGGETGPVAHQPVGTAADSTADETTPTAVPGATPQAVIAAFEHNFGVHPGQRRNHTKGLCAVGHFVGARDLQAWSRSALFSGETIPVVARFSLPGGNPHAPDAGKAPRGMALEFQLPDGGLQHMTMLNVPVFSSATPQGFYEGLLAAAPDPQTGRPDPARQAAYRDAHPDTAALADYMQEYRPPESYANAAYFGIHAFRFVAADDTVTWVRWHFEPQDGVRPMAAEAQAGAPTDFLANALAQRLGSGPVHWQMQVTFAEPGDALDDATRAWPAERRVLGAGTLTITAAGNDTGNACESINFDPMVMADGIEAGDDPILAFRSAAYAVSFGKRLSEAAEGGARDE